MGELNLYGVYVPVLLVQALIAYVLLRFLMKWLDHLVENAWIALPNMFYLCVYVLLLGGVHWASLQI